MSSIPWSCRRRPGSAFWICCIFAPTNPSIRMTVTCARGGRFSNCRSSTVVSMCRADPLRCRLRGRVGRIELVAMNPLGYRLHEGVINQKVGASFQGELALKGGVQTQSHFMYLRMYAAGYKIFNGVQWTRASRPIYLGGALGKFCPGLLLAAPWRLRWPAFLAPRAAPPCGLCGGKRRREALNMRFILFPAYARDAAVRASIAATPSSKRSSLHGEETEEERKRGARRRRPRLWLSRCGAASLLDRIKRQSRLKSKRPIQRWATSLS
jgi:hypothetical protein